MDERQKALACIVIPIFAAVACFVIGVLRMRCEARQEQAKKARKSAREALEHQRKLELMDKQITLERVRILTGPAPDGIVNGNPPPEAEE